MTREIVKQRLEFLKKVYDETDGDENKFVNMFDIGEELGFDRELSIKIYQYLKGEGLLKPFTLGGGIGITHAGIVKVEEDLDDD